MGGQTTHATAGQALGIASMPNLRDVGGYVTGTGDRVRTGLVYRSTALDRLDGADAAGVRGPRHPDRVRPADGAWNGPRRPTGCRPATVHVVADVIGDKLEGSPGHMLRLLADPRSPSGSWAAIAATRSGCATTATSSGSTPLARRTAACSGASPSEERRPVLFHCSTGKDRTGWAAAALLLFLGVAYTDVMDDYLASVRYVEPMLRTFADDYAARGGDPGLVRSLFATLPDYLDAALDEVRRTYGDIEGYFADGLGIDPDTQAAIREALLDRG